MTKVLSLFVAAALLAVPAAPRAQASASTPDSAHRAVTKAERHEGARERSGRAEKHPEIRAAIRSLERAKVELQHSAHDFGGHRVDAIKAVDEALKQLRLALEYDEKK
jgi:hypothetical protein